MLLSRAGRARPQCSLCRMKLLVEGAGVIRFALFASLTPGTCRGSTSPSESSPRSSVSWAPRHARLVLTGRARGSEPGRAGEHVIVVGPRTPRQRTATPTTSPLTERPRPESSSADACERPRECRNHPKASARSERSATRAGRPRRACAAARLRRPHPDRSGSAPSPLTPTQVARRGGPSSFSACA